MNFKGKIALVTGSNRGLGLEMCRQLASAGVQVILSSRDEAKGRSLAEELGYSFIPMDVNITESVQRAAAKVKEKLGRLDILVNNAGILPDVKVQGQFDHNGVLETSPEVFQKAWDTNVLGVIRVCQSFVPLMLPQKWGRIVNVSSGMGQLAQMSQGSPSYRVSKTALNAVTKLLSLELQGTGILVNAVSPGWVQTDMGGKGAQLTVQQGAENILRYVFIDDHGPTGGFFRGGQLMAW